MSGSYPTAAYPTAGGVPVVIAASLPSTVISFCSAPRAEPAYGAGLSVGFAFGGTAANTAFMAATPISNLRITATPRVHHCG